MNIRNKIFMVLAAGLAAISCEQREPALELYNDTVKFAAKGGNETVVLTANYDWAAVVDGKDAQWLNIENGLGEASNKPQSFTVSASENTGATRYATLTVAMLGVAPMKISVIQDGVPGADSSTPGGDEGKEDNENEGNNEGNNSGNNEDNKEDNTKYIYLKAGVWDVDGAWFAAYFFGAGGNTSVKMEMHSTGIYKCAVPEGYDKVIFCRMNSKYSTFAWNSDLENDHVWNQSADLDVPTDNKICYNITGWNQEDGNWSTITL